MNINRITPTIRTITTARTGIILNMFLLSGKRRANSRGVEQGR
jgi:hypothetical protein